MGHPYNEIYSSAVEMKEVNLTVWIYSRFCNTLFSFRNREGCVRKGGVHIGI